MCHDVRADVASCTNLPLDGACVGLRRPCQYLALIMTALPAHSMQVNREANRAFFSLGTKYVFVNRFRIPAGLFMGFRQAEINIQVKRLRRIVPLCPWVAMLPVCLESGSFVS